MNLLFWGMTISVAGKALLAFGVIMVHMRMAKEHQIDQAVISSFRLEFLITILGLLLIVLGYVMEITFFGGFPHLLTCAGPDCTAALGAVFTN